MRSTIHTNVRLPVQLREQLIAVAAADERTLSAVVVALLDRGVTQRALEQQALREMLEQLEAKRAA